LTIWHCNLSAEFKWTPVIDRNEKSSNERRFLKEKQDPVPNGKKNALKQAIQTSNNKMDWEPLQYAKPSRRNEPRMEIVEGTETESL